MCFRMYVSPRMVHFRREAWHASVCRNRALHTRAVQCGVLWLGCAMHCGDRVWEGH